MDPRVSRFPVDEAVAEAEVEVEDTVEEVRLANEDVLVAKVAEAVTVAELEDVMLVMDAVAFAIKVDTVALEAGTLDVLADGITEDESEAVEDDEAAVEEELKAKDDEDDADDVIVEDVVMLATLILVNEAELDS